MLPAAPMSRKLLLLLMLAAAAACTPQDSTVDLPKAMVLSVRVNDVQMLNGGSLTGVSTSPGIRVEFSRAASLEPSNIAFSGG